VSERDVLVVLPTLNERANLTELLEGIRTHAPDVDVLVVDDGSPDGTAALAAEIGARLGRVEVLQRGRRLGLGTAYRDGFRVGLERGYRRFVTMDADLSHEPRYLPDLLAATAPGADADVAIGSRYLQGISVVNWDLKRLVLSVAANRYARTITGLPVRDCTSGFQCFRREVIQGIDPARLRFRGYSFLVELKYRAHERGFRLREVPIIFIDRRFGSSKLGPRHVLQSLWAVWAMRFGRG
jgi:dolichol-phosphate mannosyltransferase